MNRATEGGNLRLREPAITTVWDLNGQQKGLRFGNAGDLVSADGFHPNGFGLGSLKKGKTPGPFLVRALVREPGLAPPLAMLPPFLLRSLAASSPFVQGVLPQQNLIGVLGVQAGILLTKLFRLRQQRLATLLLLMLIDLVGVLGLRSFF